MYFTTYFVYILRLSLHKNKSMGSTSNSSLINSLNACILHDRSHRGECGDLELI